VFQKIGAPPSEPFSPDPFQVEALERLQEHDVLVSAPTGAGKTWVAAQVIRQYLSQGLRIWYASPLKALTNSIYQEFSREFGPPYCGILTGDRKENPQAPVVVGTTEILRNQLYDAMQAGTSIDTDLVILDEAHYLSDPDRGVVWEEVLIYLPSRVKLLLLSATISNGEEVCRWLEEVRGRSAKVVSAEERPVPLEMLFLFPDGGIAPLQGKKGLNTQVKKFLASEGRRRKRPVRIDFGEIISRLRELNLLPAIFFLKSRADCDRAIESCPPVSRPEIRGPLKQALDGYLEVYPHLKRHRQIGPLLDSLVASHHGGQLPYWKVVVEQLMNRGLLEAIFSTSTVAAGVNFPSRTVVLLQSDRYNGREFTDLTATELHQMIGRAGRRGKDRIGFGLLLPGIHQDPQLIHQLKDSPPEPLASQIRINFSMSLNLLLSHRPADVKDLLEYSFATFQQQKGESPLSRRWDQMRSDLARLVPEGRCDTSDPFEVLDYIQRRSELEKQIKRLHQAARYGRLDRAYRDYLVPGRLIRHKNQSVYLVLDTFTEKDMLMCAVLNLNKGLRNRKNRLKVKKLDLYQISSILDRQLELPEDESRMEERVGTIAFDQLQDLSVQNGGEDPVNAGEVERLKREIEALPCEGCKHWKICHRTKKGELRKLLGNFRALQEELEGMDGGLWLSFKRHLRFLKETGFVDAEDRLTPDGYWASKLRLDQPLLIAEAIRKGAFDGVGPQVLAGGMAPFVWDRGYEVEIYAEDESDLSGVQETFQRILEKIDWIRWLKKRRGFDNSPVLFWPAVALFLWAGGISWEKLLGLTAVDEGDMASLITRTADHLRQVVNLEETHPSLAGVAEEAIGRIMREPVYIE